MSEHADYIAAQLADMAPPTPAEIADLQVIFAPAVEAVLASKPAKAPKRKRVDSRRAA